MGLLCLDLDGTLVESALEEVEQGGKSKLQPAPGLFTEPRLRPNVAKVVERMALDGDSFAIVTNQGGIAWGYYTEEEAWARIGRAVALLHGFYGRPFSVHVCFAHPKATIERYRGGHERRKPSGAMINEAMRAHGSWARFQVVMVGDLEADEAAARDAGVDFVPAGQFFTW